jgi:hypothetical protein
MNQSSNGIKIRFAIGFIIVAGLMAVIAISLLIHAGTASANSSDLANAEGAFPVMVGSRIDTCALCHTASVPPLNLFGAAYKAAGRSMAAALAIQNVDTDGDGFTNLQEINAFTFPADPNDHPASATATNTLSAPTNTQPAGPTATQPAGLIAIKRRSQS